MSMIADQRLLESLGKEEIIALHQNGHPWIPQFQVAARMQQILDMEGRYQVAAQQHEAANPEVVVDKVARELQQGIVGVDAGAEGEMSPDQMALLQEGIAGAPSPGMDQAPPGLEQAPMGMGQPPAMMAASGGLIPRYQTGGDPGAEERKRRMAREMAQAGHLPDSPYWQNAMREFEMQQAEYEPERQMGPVHTMVGVPSGGGQPRTMPPSFSPEGKEVELYEPTKTSRRLWDAFREVQAETEADPAALEYYTELGVDVSSPERFRETFYKKFDPTPGSLPDPKFASFGTSEASALIEAVGMDPTATQKAGLPSWARDMRSEFLVLDPHGDPYPQEVQQFGGGDMTQEEKTAWIEKKFREEMEAIAAGQSPRGKDMTDEQFQRQMDRMGGSFERPPSFDEIMAEAGELGGGRGDLISQGRADIKAYTDLMRDDTALDKDIRARKIAVSQADLDAAGRVKVIDRERVDQQTKLLAKDLGATEDRIEQILGNIPTPEMNEANRKGYLYTAIADSLMNVRGRKWGDVTSGLRDLDREIQTNLEKYQSDIFGLGEKAREREREGETGIYTLTRGIETDYNQAQQVFANAEITIKEAMATKGVAGATEALTGMLSLLEAQIREQGADDRHNQEMLQRIAEMKSNAENFVVQPGAAEETANMLNTARTQIAGYGHLSDEEKEEKYRVIDNLEEMMLAMRVNSLYQQSQGIPTLTSQTFTGGARAGTQTPYAPGKGPTDPRYSPIG